MYPKVSVVVPIAPAHIAVFAWQLAALRQQVDCPEFEVIAADSSGRMSPPGSPVSVVDASGAVGAGEVRNEGWRAAQGDVVLFCDADDIVGENWVAELTKAVQTTGLAGGPLIASSRRPSLGPGLAASVSAGEQGNCKGFRKHEGIPFVSGGNFAVDRGLLAQIGGFREEYRRAQDVATSLTFRSIGIEPSFCGSAPVLVLKDHMVRGYSRRAYIAGRSHQQIAKEFGLHSSAMRDIGRPLVSPILRRARQAPEQRPDSYRITYAVGRLVERIRPLKMTAG